jgi:2-polyprenyl-3-methyl-5-hydroxy-6-metoxy-1,4-benzoquinol methylase
MNINQNINDIFFKGFYKDVWRTLIPAGLTEAEAEFIEEIAGLQPGDKVLDLMCGYGRHTLALAKKGYSLTAVDNLEEYVNEISEHAQKEALPINAVHSGVLEVEFHQTFDAVICMGNSFAFYNEDEAISLLQKLIAHLKPGGIFLINTWMIGEIAIKHYREKDWFYAGEYKYLIDNKYLFNPTRIESEHIIIRSDGATESIKGVDYIFTIAELEAILLGTGFKIKAIYSTPRKRKFQFGDTRAYIAVQKLQIEKRS